MKRNELWVLLGLGALFVLMAASFTYTAWESQDAVVNATAVSDSLFGRYVFVMPLIALLLAAAMVGGIYLAKEERS